MISLLWYLDGGERKEGKGRDEKEATSIIREVRAPRDIPYLAKEECCAYYRLLRVLISRVHCNVSNTVFTKPP
jgi:hypothetical protein